MRNLKIYLLQVSLLLVVTLAVTGCAHGTRPTALDAYVKAPDSHYSYKLESTIPGQGFTGYVLNMTSQKWRSETEVDRPVWTHWLVICRPDTVKTDKALLFIGGGNNRSSAPTSVDGKLSRIALATQSVVAELRMVPNQPLTFIADDTRPRSEDSFIAYTWDKFLKTGDKQWPARLPMTKSAVRAMDTVTAFCAGPEGGKVQVKKFVVTGGSKRGWTTWTTAAVDKRVIAIAPIVIDMLNLEPSFKHHFEAYGRWAEAVGDYDDMGLMEWMGTPEYHALLKIVEPYQYRGRYTMPKFIINATGDQFFLLDSSQFYFDDLPGEKYLRYVPNADHGLGGSDAAESLLAYYAAIVTGHQRPRFSWTLAKDGSIRVKTVDQPIAVKLWKATNPDARDFRVEKLGKVWTSEDLADQGKGIYIGRVPAPPKGWTAFLVELTFESGASVPFKFTTPVRVVPDTMPYKYQKPASPPKGFITGKRAAKN